MGTIYSTPLRAAACPRPYGVGAEPSAPLPRGAGRPGWGVRAPSQPPQRRGRGAPLYRRLARAARHVPGTPGASPREAHPLCCRTSSEWRTRHEGSWFPPVRWPPSLARHRWRREAGRIPCVIWFWSRCAGVITAASIRVSTSPLVFMAAPGPLQRRRPPGTVLRQGWI